MMSYLGIDPGATGALVLLREGRIIDCKDAPYEGKDIDLRSLWTLLQRLHGLAGPELRVLIEEAPRALRLPPGPPGGSSSRDYASSSAVAGINRSMGIYLGMVTALQVPFMTVTPQKWLKPFSLQGGHKAKRSHVLRARELWPDYAGDLFLISKDGRADAALIAEWGRRFWR